MEDTVLLGEDRTLRRIPVHVWKRELEDAPASIAPRLAYMGEAHHRVRNLLVRQLPSEGADGLSPATISERLNLSAARVHTVLDDLERNLFFLVRDPTGQGHPNVTWAFPVTVHPTPHRIAFSTGETTYGA